MTKPIICGSPKELLRLPPSNRKFILIASSTASAQQGKDQKEKTDDILGIAGVLAKIPLLPLPIWGILLVGGIAYWAVEKFLRDNKVDLPEGTVILTTTDVGGLTLPLGHPVNNGVYASNPVNDRQYFPLSRYHIDIFQSKTMELVRLLRHLGAKSIEIENFEGMSINADAGIDVSGFGSLNAGRKQGATKKITWSSEYPRPNAPPNVPENMNWLAYEPSWREIADGRIKQGLERFSIKLEHTDDFGVNIKVAGEFKKAKAELSGEFKESARSINSVTGEFWPIS